MKPLPQVVVEAFRKDAYDLVEPRIMDFERYVTVSRILDPGLGEDERSRLAKQAADTAGSRCRTSFATLSRVLRESEFDWEAAKIASVRAKIRDEEGARWTDYSESEGVIRLDAHLKISAFQHFFQLKIDDCFLVDGNRYAGGGFRVY